ncbi:MAG: DUF7473 family protein, partial [Halovenus sp.]
MSSLLAGSFSILSVLQLSASGEFTFSLRLSRGSLPAAVAGQTSGQSPPFVGTVVATVGVLLAVWLFYAITLHLAATFFLGNVRSQRAATVGAVPALVSILLGRWGLESVGFVSRELGVLIVVGVTLATDALAIARVY